ncbi:MAG TPA: hypothetical protein VGR46_13425 [Candidatus Limnocylindria bacterium]|jgi:hypothetical protein|nr:hypothetical protein [Candidatus Limnocylindria bacterium]
MGRIVLVFALTVLGLVPFAGSAAAGCLTCFDQVTLQTPDRHAWSSGQPVTVVVSAHSSVLGAQLPANGVVVVMRTDGDRTKCLEVPLRLVSSDGGRGLYAGIFYPFRAAAYDGKLSLGDEVYDISFDVNRLVATTPVAPVTSLPVGSTEEPDAFTLPSDIGPVALLGLAVAFWSAIGLLMVRRRSPRPAIA